MTGQVHTFRRVRIAHDEVVMDELGQRLAVASLLALLASCNGGYDYTPGNYPLTGSITGLSAAGLVLANGTDRLPVATGSATFTMPANVTAGTYYALTVATQPTGLVCYVLNGAGLMFDGGVGGIAVDCQVPGPANWTWTGGASVNGAAASYGTLGTAAAGNQPGARFSSLTWTDATGKLWLFGGLGGDANGNSFFLNDLWSYDPGTGLWTWVGGSSVPGAAGVYGTQGVAAAANVPGARTEALGWTDGHRLWLFGGLGVDAAGHSGVELNDLWQYDLAAGTWTWVGGAATADPAASYGMQGVAAAGNVPGARYAASGWIDASGSLWLFGGLGNDGSGTDSDAEMNDLWRFDPAGGQWTWVGGSSTAGAPGIYGVIGTAAAGQGPGARRLASAWTDAAGNFWLFGGWLHDTAGNVGAMNDLWRFSPGANTWTWMGGASLPWAAPVYGVLGTAAPSNVPAARSAALGLADAQGRLWLLGGRLRGPDADPDNEANDLWLFDPSLGSTGEWTWMGGLDQPGATGVYGTLGQAGSGSLPGARSHAPGWIANNVLWLLGGFGLDATGAEGWLNDQWQYSLPSPPP